MKFSYVVTVVVLYAIVLASILWIVWQIMGPRLT